MFNLYKMLKLSSLALAATLLYGCGGGDSTSPGSALLTCTLPQIPNATNSACIDPPPFSCPKGQFPNETNDGCQVGKDPNAPMPVVMAGPDQAVLFYKRPQDGVYEGFRLHTWNNEACDAYLPSSIAPSWDNGLQYNGVDPNYGAYWILNLKPGYAGTEGACGNFIIHIGTDDAGKDPGPDMQMPLSQDDPDFARMNWVFSGNANVYEFPIVSLGVSIQGASAHWLTANTFVWNTPVADTAPVVKLFYSTDAKLTVNNSDEIEGGSSIELTPVSADDSLAQLVPHLANAAVFSANFTTEQAKSMAKNQLALAAYNSDNELISASYVQVAKVLDDLYASGDNSALDAQLGLRYNGNDLSVAVWAPTARSVKLKVYNASKALTATHNMTSDTATGVWRYSGTRSALDRQFYRFEVEVYHPLTRKVEIIEATDPYSVNVSTNGRYSQFVDLNDDDTKPEGWDSREVPVVANPTDIVIYEGHVRDFSIRDQSTPAAHRGKYLAFAEADSAPVRHLRKLAENGLTHFHVLPLNDQANINEDANRRVNLTDTIGRLCQLNAQAPVCGVENANATIESVLQSYLPYESKAQALVQSMRAIDGFNWGYDPHHFIAVEGSYASNPEGIARIKEVRTMNKALNELGLRVALDVVYNHTSSSGLFDNSVFDKIVPGYYHRYSETTGNIERSTCCENTATEHKMFDKFIKESLVILSRDFGFNDFRFDIMGHHPKEGILAAREAVRAVDPDVYFYGEGWNFGEVANNRLFTQAKQQDMAGTEVGTFNDRIREAVRSAALFSGVNNDGNLAQQDFVRISLAGTLKDFVFKNYRDITGPASSANWNSQAAGYAESPADIINYVSKHDNETLWDNLQAKLPESMALTERVRAQNVAIAIPLMSQGIPFLQLGGDFLRSKSMDRDSYDSGDWFNFVDFTYQTNNWAVGLPLAEKNEASWENIARLFLNRETKPASSDIRFAAAVFAEFLSIRSGSPLFRLRTADEITARLGFHNIGRNQQQGLIVMSLDDGIGVPDLDPLYDALVVVINGTAGELSHTVPTAAGFELHPIQQASVDQRVHSASFRQGSDEGTFTVPANTIAVFVKPQMGAQGPGLAADATLGAPDIPPYAATDVFIRGGFNGWGEADAFNYDGAGIYTASINIDQGSYEFKVASSDWSTVNMGAGAAGNQVVVGTPLVIQTSNDNLRIDIAKSSTYVFTLNANNAAAPTLTVSEYVPYGPTTIFLRGGMNGWGEANAFNYIGGNKYSVDINITARDYEFKVASSDWATVNLGAGAAGNTLTLGVPKVIEPSNDNLRMDFTETATYNFLLDATYTEEPELTVTKKD
ncbi:alpha-1,6-glucosidase domain-containing protein [Alishewanella jeotgali]|uniref:Alpha-1,6-glucosidase n=1 Tax=Alishewanella jeotgali KCTC 22429 TaxID=1129374 RepID=H3ZDZ3_9ALTE|nr:alpha-1,6-glucosidase domain-containing protein [Alishewanella jeotgali]EHR41170.1 alpha-1,6-glucosidase [Alishewanella jeotgali KCTC 22429]